MEQQLSATTTTEEKGTKRHRDFHPEEFREKNFKDYNETVTIFCVNDFFRVKKLSQPVLQHLERMRRSEGIVQKKPRVKRRRENWDERLLEKLSTKCIASN